MVKILWHDGIGLQAPGARPVYLADAGERGGGDLGGAARLPARWDRLAQSAAYLETGVDPVDYIATTLRAIIDGHSRSRIDDLMPWRFRLPSSLAA